jgi:hypothetical protein
MHARLSGARQAGTRDRRGPFVAVRGKPTVHTDRPGGRTPSAMQDRIAAMAHTRAAANPGIGCIYIAGNRVYVHRRNERSPEGPSQARLARDLVLCDEIEAFLTSRRTLADTTAIEAGESA